MGERRCTDEPLGSPFVPDGDYWYVLEGKTAYGPFFEGTVAYQWMVDAEI